MALSPLFLLQMRKKIKRDKSFNARYLICSDMQVPFQFDEAIVNLKKLVNSSEHMSYCIADIGDDSAIEKIKAVVSQMNRTVRMVVHAAGVPVAGGVLEANPLALSQAINIKAGGMMAKKLTRIVPQSNCLIDVTLASIGMPATSNDKVSPKDKPRALTIPCSIEISGNLDDPCHRPATNLFFSGSWSVVLIHFIFNPYCMKNIKILL